MELNLCSCFLSDLLFCLSFESLAKMFKRLTLTEKFELETCYKVWRSVVLVQRWSKTIIKHVFP